mgnify:CR=1 FL=1
MKSNDILIPMADLNNNGIPDHVEALAKLAGILLIVLGYFAQFAKTCEGGERNYNCIFVFLLF